MLVDCCEEGCDCLHYIVAQHVVLDSVPMVLHTKGQEFHHMLACTVPACLALTPPRCNTSHLCQCIAVGLRGHPSCCAIQRNRSSYLSLGSLLLLSVVLHILSQLTLLGPHVRLEKGRQKRVHVLVIKEVEERVSLWRHIHGRGVEEVADYIAYLRLQPGVLSFPPTHIAMCPILSVEVGRKRVMRLVGNG